MSLLEAFANVTVGFVVALVAQVMVFPWFGIQTNLAENLGLAGLFTVVSIARSFLFRRLFEAIRHAGRSTTSLV